MYSFSYRIHGSLLVVAPVHARLGTAWLKPRAYCEHTATFVGGYAAMDQLFAWNRCTLSLGAPIRQAGGLRA